MRRVITVQHLATDDLRLRLLFLRISGTLRSPDETCVGWEVFQCWLNSPFAGLWGDEVTSLRAFPRQWKEVKDSLPRLLQVFGFFNGLLRGLASGGWFGCGLIPSRIRLNYLPTSTPIYAELVMVQPSRGILMPTVIWTFSLRGSTTSVAIPRFGATRAMALSVIMRNLLTRALSKGSPMVQSFAHGDFYNVGRLDAVNTGLNGGPPVSGTLAQSRLDGHFKLIAIRVLFQPDIIVA